MNRSRGLVTEIAAEHGPGDPSILIGERHGRDVRMPTLPKAYKPAAFLPQVQAGKANFLIVTNRERSPLAPDVVTASEAGYPELTFDGVVGFYGRRDIPVALKERIAADINAVGAEPSIKARVEALGSVVRLGTSAEFGAMIDEQGKKIRALNAATVHKVQ